MFERITYMSDEYCTIKLSETEKVTQNLMNLHLILEDDTKKILAEVNDVDDTSLKAKFLGEIVGDRFVSGTIRKPNLDAKVRIIDQSEVSFITGLDTDGYMKLGVSPFYNDAPVFLDVNNFFSNHFAIFGNTGSGKSCGTTRLFQNMFHDSRLNPYKANLFIFDSSGEYYSAFSNLNQLNVQYNYRYITTNETDGVGEALRLPIYLLGRDDLALLLQCTQHSQLPIIERMLKLALAFSQEDVDAEAYKNHLIAKAIMTILYTNETAPNKRNEIFSIIASCSTEQFNLEAPLQGVGYVRKFRECFLIDNAGNFTESVLLTEYLNSFIKEEFDTFEPKGGVYYDLNTLEKALNFTLISEGWLRNEQTYGDAVTIRVRLHSLITGSSAKYFDYSGYTSLESYISSLLIRDGRKYQIVNINLNDVDDDFAKVLTKIYSRLIFDFSKGLKERASIPFHIVLEEAHRYIQNDQDRFLLGYNIFERIAKEGRKYGVILGLISQRPVEISDTVISQCSNFLIFKINHPVDVEYIRKMVPNITEEIVEKQKALQTGTCLGFGLAFKIPIIVRMEMPDPLPTSGNCNVVGIWKGNESATASDTPIVPDSVNPGVVTDSSTSVVEVPSMMTVDTPVQTPEMSGVVVQAPVEVPSTEAVMNVVETPIPNTVSAPTDVMTSIQIPSAAILDSVSVNNEVAPAEPLITIVDPNSNNDPLGNVMPNTAGESPVMVSSEVAPSTEVVLEIPKVDNPVNNDASNLIASLQTDSVGPVLNTNPVAIPAMPVAPSPLGVTSEEKFDDSFVITDGSVQAPPVQGSGISEIANVSFGTDGMIQGHSVSVPGMEGPLLELTDEDEDEGIDFE